MTRLQAELDSWRNPNHWDHEPSEAEVLDQFTYSVISKFLDYNWDELMMVTDEYDTLLNTWMNRVYGPRW